MSRHVVQVWDLPVRLVHWLLAALVGFSWWSAEAGGLMLQYHMWSGYTILTLVLFRIAWGFAGSDYARFSSFVRGPRRVLGAARELLDRRPLVYPGHNPLGGWMVLLLLASLLVQATTGLFANDDLFNEGPLYAHVSKAVSDRLTAVHHLNFVLLSTLVAVHVLAVAYHRVRKGERLVAAMVTGRKALPEPAPRARPTAWWRAMVLIGASAAIVGAVVNL